MRIHLANESKQTVGGGFTFLRTFEKYARKAGVDFGGDPKEGNIFFIAGATMVQRQVVEEAKRRGLKIVLRVDNVPKNSRNRNTGTSRLKDFAEMADLVIYQSPWAQKYLSPFLKKTGVVILNGADEEIFNMGGPAQPKEAKNQYLFAQYNRDETKRWHEAWYWYQRAFLHDPDSHLWIVGNFSPENIEYNFDFFMGEKYRYVGVLDNPEDFAEYLRGTDTLLLPYYNDACSNTLIEARLCGVKHIKHNNTGGNPAIMEADLKHLTATRMVADYLDAFRKLS